MRIDELEKDTDKKPTIPGKKPAADRKEFRPPKPFRDMTLREYQQYTDAAAKGATED